MSVAVVIPWRPGCPHRQAALDWVTAQYRARYPGWEIALGTAPAGPWCKALGVAAAVARTRAQVLVVADADVWTPGVGDAAEAVDDGAAWVVPHHLVHRLSPSATADVLAGAPIEGRAGARRRRLDQWPYAGVLGGGIVVLSRDLYHRVPLDPRFRGWGGEDHAWGYALACLAGPPRRGRDPLWHLWHPPQPRLTRQAGSAESERLRLRYARARRAPQQMRALIDEARHLTWPHGRGSGSTTAQSVQ